MKAVQYSIILFVVICAMIFISILTKGTLDLLFALLGGAIIGAAFSMFATIKFGASAGLKIFMASVIAAGALWFVSAIIISILTISLYSTTAMLFDLVIGIIGAITVASICLDKLLNPNETEQQP